MSDSTPHGSHVPAEGPAVGQDEWVARHAERRLMPGGPLGTIEDRVRRVPCADPGGYTAVLRAGLSATANTPTESS